MKSTQVTTWRRYTAAEKKAYQARLQRKIQFKRFEVNGVRLEPWLTRIILVVGAS